MSNLNKKYRPNLDEILKKMPDVHAPPPPIVDGVPPEVLKNIAREVAHGRRAKSGCGMIGEKGAAGYAGRVSDPNVDYSGPPTPEETDDVLSVMCVRLRTLEGQSSAWKQECREKDAIIDGLRKENDGLKATIQEMNQFLKDYDLTWVGQEQGVTKPSHNEGQVPTKKKFSLYDGDFTPAAAVPQTDAVPASPGTSLPFDLSHLLSVVEQLNSIASGGVEVVKKGNIHEHRPKAAIDVDVYLDGIVVNKGPFRQYDTALCDAFLKDVLEGYFPYEFKLSHPEGVQIVINHTNKESTFDSVMAKSSGPTQNTKVHGIHDPSPMFRRLSQNEFLQRLPAKRIGPSGQIIDVRSGVMEFMGIQNQPSQGAREALPFPSSNGGGVVLRVTRCHNLAAGPWEMAIEDTTSVEMFVDMVRKKLSECEGGVDYSGKKLEVFVPMPRLVITGLDPNTKLGEFLKDKGLTNVNLMLKAL